MRIRILFLALAVAGCSSKAPRSEQTAQPPTSHSTPTPASLDSLYRMAQLLGSLDMQALGTEPFWSVEITSAGMTYRAPEHPGGIVFPYVAPAVNDSSVLFESSQQDALPRTLRLSIQRRPCSDGMSDRRYSYAAEAWLDGVQLHGCARYVPRR